MSVGAFWVLSNWCELKAWFWFMWLNKRKGKWYHLLVYNYEGSKYILYKIFYELGPKLSKLFNGWARKALKHNYAVLYLWAGKVGELLFVCDQTLEGLRRFSETVLMRCLLGGRTSWGNLPASILLSRLALQSRTRIEFSALLLKSVHYKYKVWRALF